MEIDRNKEIENLESNLYRMQEHLVMVDNEREKGWTADVCLLEMKHRLRSMIDSYQKLFDS